MDISSYTPVYKILKVRMSLYSQDLYRMKNYNLPQEALQSVPTPKKHFNTYTVYIN